MNYYNVIADDVYLWDYNAFTTRTGYNWPKNIFSNQTLPPRTQPSENLGSLPKGTRLELKEILFGNYARQNSKRYTVCLFEATLSGGARKQGFVYVMYADQPQVMQETPIINRNRDPESFTSRCQQLANNVRNAISNGWTAFWEDEEEIEENTDSNEPVKPVDNGLITSEYDEIRSYGIHGGIDIASTSPSDVPIYSAYSGTVKFVGWQYPNDPHAGLGYYIKIIDSTNQNHFYGHLRANSTTVSENQQISVGTQIGIMGNTGHCIGEYPASEPGRHLHYQIIDSGNQKINPTEVRKLYD